ncbi:MAG: SDR family oxidoreductase [Proteobacteria bacterium]|nr:SDR family oxidoreductase [Pseudomonadota bacterium]
MAERDLDGKSAIVTGSSRGIGEAIAVALAERGARLTLTGRDAEALASVAANIAGAGGSKPVTVVADLRQRKAADGVVAAAVKSHGGVDILVNNAGATKRGDFLTLTDDDFDDGFALKYHGAVRMTRAAWPHLVKAHGKLVNIVGIGALTPTMDFTIGASVNAAIIAFGKAMADRGLKDGVRVNTLNPGHIVTDRLRRRVDALARAEGITYEAAEERSRQEHGILRFGQASEIAEAVAFLVSDRARYIHGAMLEVDGGATKGI